MDKRPLNLGRVIIDRNIYGLFIETKEGLRSIAKISTCSQSLAWYSFT